MTNKTTKRKLTISGIVIIIVAITLTISLGSCEISYLTQAMAGHFRIMNARQPIVKVLKKGKLSQDKLNKLKLVLEIHDFAINELSLPKNKSYTLYSEISEEYPGWNVYCAPELSLEPKTWCFPVAGCVVYHGYFKKYKALEFAEKMKLEDFDVYVSPFTAYSTLGWYKDPILSNHLAYDSIRLAELIIHELAHQRFYLPDNSEVSESFAVTVERAGVLHWLDILGRDDQKAMAIKRWEEDDHFVDRMLDAKEELNSLYTSHQDREKMLLAKDSILQALEEEVFNDNRKLNNAIFVPISTYNSLVPRFQGMLDSCGGHFSEFYKKMEQTFDSN